MLVKGTKEENRTGNLLYVLAIILFVIWATGFFAYNVGNFIHILLALAVVFVLLRLMTRKW
jgi:hypothetical protein